MMVGGASGIKEVTDEVQKICDAVRDELETKAGKKFTEFTAKHYKSQVVAGTNYFVKIYVGEEKFIHVRIWAKLSGEYELSKSKLDLTDADELVYF